MPKSADAFFPDRPVTGHVVALVTSAAALMVTATLLAANACAADPPRGISVPALAPANPALPIDLDAAFSEFDRRNNRLIFRQLKIKQGALEIKADEATAEPADFENSLWIFTGNVSINNADTKTDCDRAELSFRGNRLRKAVLTGKPAHFSQAGTGGNSPTEGRAQLLEYDLDATTIQLITDAFLSDGKSEISGSRIAYDLQREVVTAGGAQGDQVRMRITPPQKATSPAQKP